ncbi:hypothetical protein B0H17DRAFT_1135521 [Mycena rosella]|uniref:Uncharacterized protein n=1 Tax=Mycena rosella TaxID=1033263 RepID=A0AAD7GH00_MYCRO|nr:hypothetical protein B0H17DRAFT_1135521 [Mycena rosella]
MARTSVQNGALHTTSCRAAAGSPVQLSVVSASAPWRPGACANDNSATPLRSEGRRNGRAAGRSSRSSRGGREGALMGEGRGEETQEMFVSRISPSIFQCMPPVYRRASKWIDAGSLNTQTFTRRWPSPANLASSSTSPGWLTLLETHCISGQGSRKSEYELRMQFWIDRDAFGTRRGLAAWIIAPELSKRAPNVPARGGGLERWHDSVKEHEDDAHGRRGEARRNSGTTSRSELNPSELPTRDAPATFRRRGSAGEERRAPARKELIQDEEARPPAEERADEESAGDLATCSGADAKGAWTLEENSRSHPVCADDSDPEPMTEGAASCGGRCNALLRGRLGASSAPALSRGRRPLLNPEPEPGVQDILRAAGAVPTRWSPRRLHVHRWYLIASNPVHGRLCKLIELLKITEPNLVDTLLIIMLAGHIFVGARGALYSIEVFLASQFSVYLTKIYQDITTFARRALMKKSARNAAGTTMTMRACKMSLHDALFNLHFRGSCIWRTSSQI